MPAAFLGLTGFVLVALVAFVTVALSRRQSDSQRVDAGDQDYSHISLPSLLDNDDCQYVASLGDPALLRRFRAHRRAVVAAHLDGLAAAFEQAAGELKRHVTEASEDRSDLLEWLMKEAIRFRLNLGWQRCRLALHWAGLQPDLRLPEISLARVRHRTASASEA